VQIELNGETREVDEGLTVAGLLERLGPKGVQVAVEVNARVIRRAEHATHVLAAGDRVELVTFVGGG